MAKKEKPSIITKDAEVIIGGPDAKRLFAALGNRRKSPICFTLRSDGPSRSRHVIITGLKFDWWFQDQFRPHPDLSVREMEKLLNGAGFDWQDAWLFEGHSPQFPAIPAWGIYNTKTRKGIMLSEYVGGGADFHKIDPIINFKAPEGGY